MRIDHVVLAVRDLEASAARLLEEHGIATIPGGHHPAWGTANRVAPFGNDYIELLSVVDEEVGGRTRLGSALLELSARGDRWYSICVADDDIEGTAARLDLDLVGGSRTRPDGTVIRWRGAGTEDPKRELWLPFFISWDVPPDMHPGRSSVEHPSGATGIAWAEVAGDPEKLREWLGDADVPMRVVDGDPEVRAVGISTVEGRELVLG